jgi:hypothetical protein
MEVFALHIEGRNQTGIFKFPINFVGLNVICKWGFSDPAKLYHQHLTLEVH